MQPLLNKRRAQPFRDYLDSPSWLKEEQAPVRKPTGKELLRVFAAVVLAAVIVGVLLVLWPIGERISR